MERLFIGCKTSEEVQARYRELCKQHHPDLGGSTEMMQEVNKQYAYMVSKAGQFDADMERPLDDWIREAMEVIERIKYIPGADIELCGSWVWVEFAGKPSKAVRDVLKENGLKWHSVKGKWYWQGRPATGRSDMETIRRYYGSQTVQTEERTAMPG